eukprot:CAMPEP_0175143288 /NCGR_PEP_ID=MMETSP0087-20121206/13339_1 /TAXON_ID=136419 /ORGANISM="Unknown Unknown, Strain D1" /LENGTH=418 /DNA_ID=CAMNT_0016427321 /DNA_START=20 /DNA_END=1276 /DNA_ORIENTATION=+
MLRIGRTLGHLSVGEKKEPALESFCCASSGKSDDDVVIVAAFRTAIARARKGEFAKSHIEDMLTPVLKAVLDKTKIDPATVGDVVVGNVLGQSNQRANQARIACFMAGIPETTPVHTVNRQCSSGLQALAHVAASIKAGYYDIGIGAGVESMTSASPQGMWEGSVNPKIFLNENAKACLLPMGITSENVARKYKISRQEQDELAVRSHARAAAAIKSGRFKEEIVPVTVNVKGKPVVFDTDGGCRPETTMESLSKLKPAFDPRGSTTAGTASQVSDGAAAVLAMKRSKAKELGLPIMGVFRSFAVAGVDPAYMGIGPAFAIPKALEQAGLNQDDIDLFEINEAFASQAVMSVKTLGISWDKVNVNGGAIAIGHPLGCTGARMVATLLNELEKRSKKYGVISMCIGSGMGAAAVLERED